MSSEETAAADDPRILREPRAYVREIVLTVLVSGFLSALAAFVGIGLDLLESARSALASAGGAILGDVTAVTSTLAGLVAMPIRVTGDVASMAGPAAPLVVAGTFALVAVFTAGLVWGVFRLVRFI